MPLTDVKIRSAKSREKNYKVADSGGLYLEVSSIALLAKRSGLPSECIPT